MSLNLLAKFNAVGGITDFTPEFWNAFVGEVAFALNALQEKSASFDEARAQLIQAALFRLNEILLPAFERVFLYQQAGFLTAPIADNSEVTFAEGFTTLGIHPDNRDLFRPTPFVALTRSSTHEDIAIARSDSYNPETGALALEIVAVIGAAGPWSDVIVSATAGSVAAQNQFLTETKAARDRGEEWAEKAENSAVTTGKYSAKHHALKAAASASTAEGHKNTASGAAGTAVAAASAAGTARDSAEDWAEGTEPGGAGTKSAKEHALDAAASAVAAATFDPLNYTPTNELANVALSGDYGDLENKPSLFDGDYASLTNKPSLGTAAASDAGDFAAASHTHTASEISDASANGRSLVSAANYAAMRTLLGLVVDTDVQSYDADTAKLDVAQTWTAAQLFGQIASSVLALGSGTAINCASNNAFSRTINGAVTFTITNVPASRSFGISLVLTYTSGTVTWPASVKWRDDTAPSLTGGKTYIVVLHTINGGTDWRGASMEFAG